MRKTQDMNSANTMTPFDHIKTLEKEERMRVDIEIAAMRKEEEEVKTSLARKLKEAERMFRDEVRKDLERYREEEIKSIIAKGESDAEKECCALETQFKERKEKTIKTLVSKAIDPNFLFS